MTCQLTDIVVCMAEALNHFGEYSRVQSKVNLISLVEVFVDLHQDFLFQHVISRLHFLAHFVVLEVAVGESQGALWERFWIRLIAVVRNELTV